MKKVNKYLISGTIGLLIPYSAYAILVTQNTSSEINKRQLILDKLEPLPEIQTINGTLIKYKDFKTFGRFENPFNEYRIQTIYEFFFNRIVELFERNRGSVPTNKDELNKLMPIHKPAWTISDTPSLLQKKPVAPLNFKIIDESLITDGIEDNETFRDNKPVKNTWLGQSCNFIEHGNLKILTDPHFSPKLFGKWLGPKRITEMPASIDEIPTPHVIVVSHNHPDHMDQISVDKWGNTDALWIVPKGLKKKMINKGCRNVVELNWWEACEISTTDAKNEDFNQTKYRISCVPAMHWSGRSLLDANQSLWCSFLIRVGDDTAKSDKPRFSPLVYHAGDTGYVKDLAPRIRQRYGSGVRLALLPCGQYCPKWHQRSRHIDPEEAIKITRELRAKNTLGVHWGTFTLSGEPFREPKEKLEELAAQQGIRDNCYCPELGKTLEF
ncbi:hypothetical protein TBLA_0B04420 [Henningerozyma blattae CBS 6284]|uniref:Metallo-beta-lactamase domain-containing protein n=1 Tax=Henningerozyma blattae (strain ATCC 34711 / CBS 6284 / DSM 70876 / NBRC 10599 / NRRL Y-10934 / UCD 77-7) TaxID=1071380 RepID=I2GYS7_HENB6|nr:hypothetical protein TBLA_0B04420 [Tetrapisispora blattae CBS 6284]CCH59279.1 hypothetical protein TBLA_0B04420 [Tetrapisispora blattae CBS 6284]